MVRFTFFIDFVEVFARFARTEANKPNNTGTAAMFCLSIMNECVEVAVGPEPAKETIQHTKPKICSKVQDGYQYYSTL